MFGGWSAFDNVATPHRCSQCKSMKVSGSLSLQMMGVVVREFTLQVKSSCVLRVFLNR